MHMNTNWLTHFPLHTISMAHQESQGEGEDDDDDDDVSVTHLPRHPLVIRPRTRRFIPHLGRWVCVDRFKFKKR